MLNLFNKPRQEIDHSFYDRQMISLAGEFENIYSRIPNNLRLDVNLLCDDIQYLASSMQKVSENSFKFGLYTFTINPSGILVIED